MNLGEGDFWVHTILTTFLQFEIISKVEVKKLKDIFIYQCYIYNSILSHYLLVHVNQGK